MKKTDHLGSPRMVIDVDSGAVIQEVRFDEWGVVTLDTNPGWQPFGFAGGLLDADTGLTQFGARDYAAAEGRWTAKDPIWFGGGLNFSGYVGGDPVNFIDPSGTVSRGTCVLIGMGAGGVALGIAGGFAGGVGGAPPAAMMGPAAPFAEAAFVGAGAVIGAGVGIVGGGIAGYWLCGPDPTKPPNLPEPTACPTGTPGGDDICRIQYDKGENRCIDSFDTQQQIEDCVTNWATKNLENCRDRKLREPDYPGLKPEMPQ